MQFRSHRQFLHGLAATAGIPLSAEQRFMAFRGRVEKSFRSRYGASGQVQLDRKFRRSGISHRLPRTGSHPFVLRIAVVESVFIRSLPSVNSPTKRRHSFMLDQRGRGGPDSTAGRAETIHSTTAGKSACCGIFLKWHIAAT